VAAPNPAPRDKPKYIAAITFDSDDFLPYNSDRIRKTCTMVAEVAFRLFRASQLHHQGDGDKAMSSTDDLSNLLPSAKAVRQKIALAEADKASEELRRRVREEEEKKALIDRLTKPSGLSDEEVMKKAAAIIERAARNGLTEVQVYRFPNTLCTDRGRAINQQEPGWEKTLTGIPKEIYEFWDRRLRPLEYRLQVQIVDFSGGVPGDVGMTLKWG
jgi:hypothetical protein